MNVSHGFVTTSNPNPDRNNTISTTMFFINISVFPINTILGLHVNSYVLWLICKGKGNGISAEFFSLNLALCEIFFCLGSLTFVIGLWIPSLLYIGYFVMVFLPYGRPLIQCLICIERYLAVLHPILFLKYKPLRYRLACSALAWLTILGGGVFCTWLTVKQDMYTMVCVFLSLALLLLVIQLFCSVSILKALKSPAAGQIGTDREQANSKKRKAFHLILIFTVSMFVQTLPLCISSAFLNLMSIEVFNIFFCIGIIISMIMAYVSPVHFIYRVKKQQTP